MVKRVSCKVIRSVPLSNKNDRVLYVKQQPDRQQDRIDADIWLKHSGNSVRDPQAHNFASVCLVDDLTGQALDFYA